jgi:hypothetical protein
MRTLSKSKYRGVRQTFKASVRVSKRYKSRTGEAKRSNKFEAKVKRRAIIEFKLIRHLASYSHSHPKHINYSNNANIRRVQNQTLESRDVMW